MKTFLIAIFALAVASFNVNAQVAPQVQLNWQDNSSGETQEDGTNIERQLNGGPWAVIFQLIGADLVSWTDNSVVQPSTVGAPDNVYCYRVNAFNAAGVSPYSNVACKTFVAPKLQAPVAPSGLTTAALSSTQGIASWRDNSDNETKFRLRLDQYSPRETRFIDAPADSNSIVLAGLRRNKTYCANVTAMAGDVASEPSNDSCFTTPNR